MPPDDRQTNLTSFLQRENELLREVNTSHKERMRAQNIIIESLQHRIASTEPSEREDWRNGYFGSQMQALDRTRAAQEQRIDELKSLLNSMQQWKEEADATQEQIKIVTNTIFERLEMVFGRVETLITKVEHFASCLQSGAISGPGYQNEHQPPPNHQESRVHASQRSLNASNVGLQPRDPDSLTTGAHAITTYNTSKRSSSNGVGHDRVLPTTAKGIEQSDSPAVRDLLKSLISTETPKIHARSQSTNRVDFKVIAEDECNMVFSSSDTKAPQFASMTASTMFIRCLVQTQSGSLLGYTFDDLQFGIYLSGGKSHAVGFKIEVLRQGIRRGSWSVNASTVQNDEWALESVCFDSLNDHLRDYQLNFPGVREELSKTIPSDVFCMTAQVKAAEARSFSDTIENRPNEAWKAGVLHDLFESQKPIRLRVWFAIPDSPSNLVSGCLWMIEDAVKNRVPCFYQWVDREGVFYRYLPGKYEQYSRLKPEMTRYEGAME